MLPIKIYRLAIVVFFLCFASWCILSGCDLGACVCCASFECVRMTTRMFVLCMLVCSAADALVVAVGCRCNIRVHLVTAVFARGKNKCIVLHLYHVGLLACAVTFLFTVMQLCCIQPFHSSSSYELQHALHMRSIMHCFVWRGVRGYLNILVVVIVKF